MVPNKNIRRTILKMINSGGAAHIGSALSMVEILAVLFNRVLSYCNSVEKWNDPCRDRFVLSKGHGALSLYATLDLKGFTDSMLDDYLVNGSGITAFPCNRFPIGLDFSSGSLGHGLSFSCGLSYSLRLECSEARVFVLCSDGECQEGSTWEAAQFAGHHNLSNLVVIIDRNGYQAFGKVSEVNNQDNLGVRWQGLGFKVLEVDGHDVKALTTALSSQRDGSDKPTVIIANTIKGNGVSFMEGNPAWHGSVELSDDDLRQSMIELGANDSDIKEYFNE